MEPAAEQLDDVAVSAGTALHPGRASRCRHLAVPQDCPEGPHAARARGWFSSEACRRRTWMNAMRDGEDTTDRHCDAGRMGRMSDMRRRGPEPLPGAPQIWHRPGLAKELLRELAPLLAEVGIDVDDIDVPDLETLRAAMNWAVERHNMALFTPAGRAPRPCRHSAASGRGGNRRGRHQPRGCDSRTGGARIPGQRRRHRQQLHRH